MIPHRRYLPEGLNISRLYLLYVEWMKIHHKEEPVVSEYIYRRIFNTKFNLSFQKPATDTCKTCDLLNAKLECADEEEGTMTLKKDLELHQTKAAKAYGHLKNDIKYSKEVNDMKVITFDMQQALPTPHLHTSEVFYKRQLWTYNFCIHDCTSNDVYMYVWPENYAGRGADEIVSCLSQFCDEHLQGIKTLVAYSDNCFGQNKNITVVAFWLSIIHKRLVETVEHKYLVSGHSYLPCDRDFGLIEKRKKVQKYVFTPSEWASVISQSRLKHPFKVKEMKQSDFVSAQPLVDKICNRKFSEQDKAAVNFSKIACLKLTKEHPWKYFFKHSLLQLENYSSVNVTKGKVRREKHTFDLAHIKLPVKNKTSRPIKASKLKDIKELLKYVPPIHHAFFNGLTSDADQEGHNN